VVLRTPGPMASDAICGGLSRRTVSARCGFPGQIDHVAIFWAPSKSALIIATECLNMSSAEQRTATTPRARSSKRCKQASFSNSSFFAPVFSPVLRSCFKKVDALAISCFWIGLSSGFLHAIFRAAIEFITRLSRLKNSFLWEGRATLLARWLSHKQPKGVAIVRSSIVAFRFGRYVTGRPRRVTR
jgi:hypothetical protein